MTIRRHNDDDFEKMSWRRLSDNLIVTQNMLIQAKKIADESQNVLVLLANEFCGEEMIKRLARNEDPNHIPPQELSTLLRNRFKMLKLLVACATPQRLLEADKLIKGLRTDVSEYKDQADQAKAKVTVLEERVLILEKTLSNERRSNSTLKPTSVDEDHFEKEIADFMAWFESWKSEYHTWEDIGILVCFIGESGLSKVSEIAEAIVHENHLSTRTVFHLLQECVDIELLVLETRELLDDHQSEYYTLTRKGRILHHVLTGESPMTPAREKLLKVDRSEYHMSMILESAELFEKLGYTIDCKPQRMEITGDRFFQADFSVHKDSETFYLEVEVGEQDKPSLDRKWANSLAAGGRICVVTDNLNTLRRIQGGIAQWSRFEQCNAKLYITCLPELKEKLPGDSPWYAIKDYTPT